MIQNQAVSKARILKNLLPRIIMKSEDRKSNEEAKEEKNNFGSFLTFDQSPKAENTYKFSKTRNVRPPDFFDFASADIEQSFSNSHSLTPPQNGTSIAIRSDQISSASSPMVISPKASLVGFSTTRNSKFRRKIHQTSSS